mgnify:CR=1 FL=1
MQAANATSASDLTALDDEYQQLVDEHLVEKRRGRGMFVTEGARRALLKDERQHFLEEEWPKMAGRIQRLGFEPKELLEALDKIPPAPASSLKSTQEDDAGACASRRARRLPG